MLLAYAKSQKADVTRGELEHLLCALEETLATIEVEEETDHQGEAEPEDTPRDPRS
jgi:hypothetical protein